MWYNLLDLNFSRAWAVVGEGAPSWGECTVAYKEFLTVSLRRLISCKILSALKIATES